MFVCPFPIGPKFWKTLVAFFLSFLFFFFFLIFNFAFLNKVVEINFSKCIVTVPKVNCVGTEGIYVYLHVSTRLLDVTYFLFRYKKQKTKQKKNLYMIYIAFLHSSTSRFKKKNRPTDLPIFRPKGHTNLHFFRPNMTRCMLQDQITIRYTIRN